ncbi:MAG TPA: hypothetical protein VM778_05320 [Gemmatimonadota bacterium]|nr:hypothetical protein [Gemmatimonadota bacterium]
MRATPTTIALALALMAGPALAQEGHEGMRHDGAIAVHGEKKTHMSMMHGGMAKMLEEHAEHLGLTAEQIGRLEGLDQRLEAEKERHHAEMRAIHEAAMEILTDEQRERIHALMEAQHGDGEGHGRRPEGHDRHDPPSGNDAEEESGA